MESLSGAPPGRTRDTRRLHGARTSYAHKDTELAQRIQRLVETFLTSDDAKEASVLSDARGIYELEGIPTVAKVGDAAAYGFVLVNMLGQPTAFQARSSRACGTRRLAMSCPRTPSRSRKRGSGRRRSRIGTRPISLPILSCEIRSHAFTGMTRPSASGRDSMPRRCWRRTGEQRARSRPSSIDTACRPTTWWVCRQREDFVVMVQHQPAEFRRAVLPKLKANVDVGQADPGTYAAVYDRSQRDQGKNQLYGEQLECASGKALDEAPMDDEANVNMRRAELGLMRVELYAQLVRLYSPDMCGAVTSKE